MRRRTFAATLAVLTVVLADGSATASDAHRASTVARASAVPPGAAALFVQTADSGGFVNGRLTLRGVSRHVAWFTDRPARDSGVITYTAMRRMLFSRGQPAPNAALDVAGEGLGGVVALELRRPRYNARRGTVTYRVKRLEAFGSRLEHLGDRLSERRLPRRFGSASLFIDSGSGGNTCVANVTNNTTGDLRVTSASKWDTDDWGDQGHGYTDPTGIAVGPTHTKGWESVGGFARGCSNAVTLQTADGASITVQTTDPFSGSNTLRCTTSSPRYTCRMGPGSVTSGFAILGNWVVYGPA